MGVDICTSEARHISIWSGEALPDGWWQQGRGREGSFAQGKGEYLQYIYICNIYIYVNVGWTGILRKLFFLSEAQKIKKKDKFFFKKKQLN